MEAEPIFEINPADIDLDELTKENDEEIIYEDPPAEKVVLKGTQEKPKSGHGWIWIMIVVVIILALGTAAFFLRVYLNKRSAKPVMV